MTMEQFNRDNIFKTVGADKCPHISGNYRLWLGDDTYSFKTMKELTVFAAGYQNALRKLKKESMLSRLNHLDNGGNE